MAPRPPPLLVPPASPEAPALWHRPDAPALAVRLAEGASPGITYLQGLASDMEGTKAVFTEYLARKHGRACLRQDYRGVGAAEGAYEDGSVASWYADARACFDAFTTGRQILVGSSMGGWLGIMLALQRPERVAGALMLAPSIDFHPMLRAGMTSEQKAQLAAEGRYERLPGLWVGKALAEEDDSCHLFPAASKEKIFDKDDKIPLPFPIRIIWGSEDEAVPWERTIALAESLASPDLRLERIEGAGHRLSSPQALLRIAANLEELPLHLPLTPIDILAPCALHSPQTARDPKATGPEGRREAAFNFLGP